MQVQILIPAPKPDSPNGRAALLQGADVGSTPTSGTKVFMERVKGKCGFCSKSVHRNAKYCLECRTLFNLILQCRKYKRKTERATYKKILAYVKYTEVLEAMSR